MRAMLPLYSFWSGLLSQTAASGFSPLLLMADRLWKGFSALFRGEAFVAQFFDRLLRLVQPFEAHALQDLGRFGELYLRVVDDLPVVAPRVEEVEAPARQYLHPHLPQGAPDRLPVVDHHPDVPVILR